MARGKLLLLLLLFWGRPCSRKANSAAGNSHPRTVQLCVLMQDETVLVALTIRHAGFRKLAHDTLQQAKHSSSSHQAPLLALNRLGRVSAAATATAAVCWAFYTSQYLGTFVHKVQGSLVVGLFEVVCRAEPEEARSAAHEGTVAALPHGEGPCTGSPAAPSLTW